MSWMGVQGHDRLVERFRKSLVEGRLASTFLFVGPPGVGKRAFANRLAQVLLCQVNPPARMQPCGQCEDCQMVLGGSHPDMEVVVRPADKSTIPLELLIGGKEQRMQEGLCHRISLRPYRGGRKVAIIDDADHLNQEGANCLLKTLEEPPPRSVLILIGTSEQKQLPTIRSRCQIIHFSPLPDAVLADLLTEHGWAADPDEARQLARLGQGSIERALRWRDEQLADFRETFLGELAKGTWNASEVAPLVSSFVDQAGTDAPPRRQRLRLTLELAADFYSQLMRGLCGGEMPADERTAQALQQAADRWRGNAETAGLCVDRCVEAMRQVDANANQATVIDCWADDLEQVTWLGRRHQATW